MAQQPDIVGMFTGISSNKQPIVNDPTGAIGRIRQNQQNLRGAVTGMFGKETSEVRQQRQVADLIANFDTMQPAQQRQIIAQLQAVGQTGLAKQLAAGQKQTKLTEDALLVANSLPPEYSQLALAIKKGVKGSLAKGIEILGRKQTEAKQPKGEKPSATDIKAAKKALSLAGEEAKGGEGFLAFLDADWNDAWNNQTEAAQDLLAEQVAEVTNKLIDGGMDLSQARKLAIKKMYTDNLTETGLFEWGESRMMTPDEIEEKQKQEILKQEQLKEAKTKADLEKIMQERLSEKEQELAKVKDQIKKEKVDNSILSIANKEKSINAQQVVSLLKNEVKYNDDGRIEIVDNHSNVRYNAKGELLTIEDRVKEFLDSNPHFRQGSLSGSGSQSAIGGKTVKPFNLQDLDLTKPEDRKAYAEYRKKRDSGAVEINLTK